MTANSSSFVIPTTDNSLLDYTEIDQGLNLWSEILPLIEKQIVTLTTVAQEMQECPDRDKYVDVLMKIAVRVNDVEEKATKCIKEARTQLKKTKLIDKENNNNNIQEKLSKNHEENSDEDDQSDREMEIDESQIDEQIEVSALTVENLDKLQNLIHKVLIKQPDSDAFNIDADNRYADFVECISKMQGNNEDEDDDDDDANVVDQVISNKCPLTQKPFIEPVQNKKCKHKYEKKTVLKYISDKNKTKRPAKCPSAGCENILHEKDLINI